MKVPATRTEARERGPRLFEQSFSVRHSYPVYFTRGALRQDCSILKTVLSSSPETADARVIAVVDDGVARHHPSLMRVLVEKAQLEAGWKLVDEPLLVPGGEDAKNDSQLIEGLYRKFEKLGLDRHAYVLCIGGGAVLDAVGFAAATTHRGLRLVRMPTTVLGQNDSGVGVKNGINRFGAKNFIGSFAPPWAVVNDYDFLSTLSDRDFRAGLAESLKVALIKDGSFFHWMQGSVEALGRREHAVVETAVERTALLHLEHISSGGDPFEAGSSRPLDFGHWAAHKLESLTKHQLRHGEAVAIGIALDTLYSVSTGLLPEEEGRRVISVICELGLPIYSPALELPDGEGRPAYLAGLEEFRQHLGGGLSVTLLAGIGRGVQVGSMDLERIEMCRRRLAALSNG